MDETQINEWCLEHFIEKILNCTLPWFPRNGRKICSNENDFKAFADIMITIDEMDQKSQIEFLKNVVGCKTPCDVDQYKFRYTISNFIFCEKYYYLKR